MTQQQERKQIANRVASLIRDKFPNTNVRVVNHFLTVNGTQLFVTEDGYVTTPFSLDYKIREYVKDLNSDF
jgi:hypothetical protein